METQEVKKQRRKAHLSADKLNELIIDAIQDKKGLDVVQYLLTCLERMNRAFNIVIQMS